MFNYRSLFNSIGTTIENSLFIGASVGAVVLVLLLIAIIVFQPFIIIWAINVLFGVGIPYTFKTWLAMFTIIMVIRSNSAASSNSKDKKKA